MDRLSDSSGFAAGAQRISNPWQREENHMKALVATLHRYAKSEHRHHGKSGTISRRTFETVKASYISKC
jgi:hypothetical protein